MTLLEAMSYAIPVVSTRVGGIPELVLDGQTGFLVEPGDLDGLRGKIGELIANQEKRRAFGLCGRRVIEEKYNIANNIRIVDDIYNNL